MVPKEKSFKILVRLDSKTLFESWEKRRGKGFAGGGRGEGGTEDRLPPYLKVKIFNLGELQKLNKEFKGFLNFIKLSNKGKVNHKYSLSLPSQT